MKKILALFTILLLHSASFAVPKSNITDTDGDGVFDNCDLDSDNDGIPDTWEDLNNNGIYSDDDVDGDNLVIATLGDGISSFLDLDSDNDGVPDLMESGISLSFINLYDPNHTGVLSGSVGVNGLLDALETFPDSGIPRYTLRNTDGDDKPDFVDLKSNGPDYDLYVSGNDNLDQLGAGFITPVSDEDKDGILTAVDSAPTVRGTVNAKLLPTTIAYTMVSSATNVGNAADPICSTLPVKLGYFTVKILAGQMLVAWGTTSETDNDHFDIEVSTNAINFKSIKTVESKSKNGNSLSELDYNESFDIGQVAFAGLSFLWLGMISFARSKRRFVGILTAAAVFFAIGSCSSDSKETNVLPGQTIYVRLLQFDKDGTKTYSRIASVINNSRE